MKFDSETTYIYSKYGVLRCVRLFEEDGVWWTREGMPAKAITIDLSLFKNIVGTEVKHKRFGCVGKVGFYCTADSYSEIPSWRKWKEEHEANVKKGLKRGKIVSWFHKDRKLCQFVHVRWSLVEGNKSKEIVSAWTNINDLEFSHPIQFL